MKQILMALTITGLSFMSAEAQNTQSQVCRMSPKKGESCYTTKFAENYKVCKNNSGYFICGETPNYANSTHPHFTVSSNMGYTDDAYAMQNNTAQAQTTETDIVMVAPQSQSYPNNTDFGMTSSSSYEGYYGKRNYMKVCYVGDNVAENNRNPYHGCPSPQDEGPERNNERNKNVSNPVDLPPVNGRSHE